MSIWKEEILFFMNERIGVFIFVISIFCRNFYTFCNFDCIACKKKEKFEFFILSF